MVANPKQDKDPATKSVKINMILNSIKGVMAVLFPLVSFPYISRVLGAEQIGKYNFSNSIVSYFSLLAGLGIAAYARREGSIIRKEREKISSFSSEMLSINLLTTLISYATLFCVLLLVPFLRNYSIIILVLSLSILLNTIAVEWIYMIFEDYAYITIRSIVFQLLALIALFLFVKEREDLIKYTWITVIASAGSSLLNFIHSRRYVDFRLTLKLNLKKHLKSILVFWASTVAITIYVSSDITILGFICDDYVVGIYSVSVKIYTIVKNILASAIVVVIPRLCFYIGEKNESDFKKTAVDTVNTIFTITIPALVGICVYCKEIVLFVGGNEFADAYKSLFLLSISLFCYMFAFFWGQCVLIPLHKERIALFASVASAISNIILNFVFIPFLQESAAAITTIIGEGTAAIICMYYSRRFVRLPNTTNTILKTLIGCLSIILITISSKFIIEDSLLRLIVGVVTSVVVYFLLEVLMKNESMLVLVKHVIKRGGDH